MKEQGVLLDTNSHSAHIKPSIQGSMTLNLRDHMASTLTLNQVEVKRLADIPVVCEYPDVFPDDLSGMLLASLDPAIEFVGELAESPT